MDETDAGDDGESTDEEADAEVILTQVRKPWLSHPLAYRAKHVREDIR